MPKGRRLTLAVHQRQQQQASLLDEAPKLHVKRSDTRSCQLLARLCRFLLDAGRRCLLEFFQRRHPAPELKERLSMPDTYRTLRRLKIKGMLDEADWAVLYPTDKSAASADNYSLRLLLVLVKYACSVERPAGGWAAEPQAGDGGHGAAVQRLLATAGDLAEAYSVGATFANKYFRRIADLLEVLEAADARQAMEEAKKRPLSQEEVDDTLEEFIDWLSREAAQARLEAEGQERKRLRPADIPLLQRQLKTRDLDASEARKRQSIVGKAPTDAGDKGKGQKWPHIKTGMVQQERRILERYYDRLLDEVKADGVVEHLAGKGVIGNDESTEIFATLRNNEQMSTLIEFLVHKSGNFFDDFLESFREKNEQLYEQIHQDYLAARAEILANKPQGLPYCQQLLKDRYSSDYSRWNPVPWYAGAETDIGEFYCQQQLMNLQGKSANPFRVFEAKAGEKAPLTVVVEGDPGAGKSTLAKYMAYCWAADQQVFGLELKLLVLLDLKRTAATVRAMMSEQLFGSDCKLAEREVWEVLEMHQEEALLVVDGYEDNLNDEMRSLLFERQMADLRILVFSQTNFTVRLMHRYQRKFILTGFAKNQAEEYVRKYVKLTKKPREHFESFLSKLETKEVSRSDTQKLMELFNTQLNRRSSVDSAVSNQSNLRERSMDRGAGSDKQSTKLSRSSTKVTSDKQQKQQQQQQQQEEAAGGKEAANALSKIALLRHYSQVPLYCSFFCLLTDMRMSIDLNSPTTIVEQFVSCVKLKLIEREKESRFEANRASVMLSELAMDTMKKGSATFLLRDDESLMTKFGLIQAAKSLMAGDSKRYMFANRLIQEYLAAKYLDTAGNDEASRFFQNMSVTPSSYNVVVFYCSIRKSENDTAAARELFSKIVQYNKRRGKASLAKMSPPTLPDDNQLVEGRIMEYQLSLECVAVIDLMRRDLGKNIDKSLPQRFIVKHEGIIPRLSLTGLSKMIRLNYDTIQEMDILLDLLAKETLEAYMSLATALKANSHIKTLRIFWTEKDLMGDFLKAVCCLEETAKGSDGERRLQNLECIDESGRRGDQLTPKMLSSMRDACCGMTHLRTFAFKSCHHQALIGAIIKHLPTKTADSLRLLDFSGCEINVVASQDLNARLVESKSLEGLVLTNLRIDSMAFNTFIEAFSSNRTVLVLDLSGIRMDTVCFFALSEALKINNKLERLVLQNVPMDTRACSEVARILKSNKSLKLLEVTEESLAPDGRRLLGQEAQTEAKRNRAFVSGLSEVYKQRPANERANSKRRLLDK